MTEEKKLQDKIEKIAEGITYKEQQFIDMVMRDVAIGKAYEDAGLAVCDGRDVPRAKSLLASPRIELYIDSLKRLVATRSVMSLEAMDARLSDIAMTNYCDIVEVGETFTPLDINGEPGEPITIVKMKDISELTEAQLSSIASIKPCKGGLEIKLHDKVKVMEILQKRQGGFVDKQEIEHSATTPIYVCVGDNGRGPKS